MRDVGLFFALGLAEDPALAQVVDKCAGQCKPLVPRRPIIENGEKMSGIFEIALASIGLLRLVVVKISKILLNPKNVENLFVPNPDHRKLSAVSEYQELFSIGEFLGNRRLDLVLWDLFGTRCVPARLMYVLPSQLATLLEGHGQTGSRLYVQARDIIIRVNVIETEHRGEAI